LKCFEPDLKLLGPAEQHDPTFVAPFESVLDLTWLPDPTKLGPAAKQAPIIFRKGSNTLSRNFCQKNTAKECPPPSRAVARHADLPPLPQGLADPALGICCLGLWPGARGGPNAPACQL